MRKIFLIMFTFFCMLAYCKSKEVRCRGTYLYVYSEHISHAEAKAKAVENAIIMALADNFGTTITSQSMLELTNSGDKFSQMSRLQVKGKLVKHNREPQISTPQYSDNQFSVNVTVDFNALPINYAPTQFVAKALRNGKDDRFESSTFTSDDKFYMSFYSPKAGYLAIFFEDKDGVSCMLPYVDDDNSPYSVVKDRRILLFDITNNTYHMTCGEESEINYVHVVFSPNKFIDGDLVRRMSCKRFRDWLGNKQSFDELMQVETLMIRVNPLQE